MDERVTKKHIDTTKIRIRIADESELTAESIKDIIEDLAERFDEIKDKLEELTDAVPENISKDVYDIIKILMKNMATSINTAKSKLSK